VFFGEQSYDVSFNSDMVDEPWEGACAKPISLVLLIVPFVMFDISLICVKQEMNC